MAADISRDVVLTQLLFDQLHRRKDRTFRTPSAEAGWAGRNHFCQGLDLGARQHRIGAWQRRAIAKHRRFEFLEEGLDALHQHASCVVAAHRQAILAGHPGLYVLAAQRRVYRLLEIVGMTFLDHQHCALALAEAHHFVVEQGIGDIQHIERHSRVAIAVGQT